MTAQELKNSILQLAVSGRLVPQDPSDEPASELLKRIRAEKLRLQKAGKIKKDKDLPEIEEDEIPFEIPESWEWVRLGDICNYGQCENIEPINIPKNLWILELEDIEKDTGRILQRKKGATYKVTSTKHLFKKDNVLFSKLRPYLKKVVVADSNGCSTSEILPLDLGEIYPFFIKYCLISPYFVTYANQCSCGTKMPRLGTNDGKKALIPLPPLAEQKRIVERIEALLPLVEEYGAAESEIRTLDAAFPDALRKSVLQDAVSGHLVPQDPNDEPASELLKRIRAEKQRLQKAGKIKKDKDLPEIEEDEIPFEIPESWEWVRLGEVIKIASNLVNPSVYQDYKHIAPDNIEKYTGRLLLCQSIKEDKIESPNHLFFKGQIIYSKIRPLLRKVVIAPFDGLCSADMYPIETPLNPKYLVFVMLSEMFNLQVALTASNRIKMPKINQRELSNILVPLPPLAEQKRIVARIEELTKIISEFPSTSPIQ